MKLKKTNDDLEDIKAVVSSKEKVSIIDKLLKSDLIDKIILKLQDFYKKTSEKLFIKYDLKNELKQGKIFTILPFTAFIFFILLTFFFVIMLNSLLGLNLLFNIVKYSIFFIRLGYKIIKKKGSVILKYLANLFPNSKVLNNKVEKKFDNLPVFENFVINEIKVLVERLEKMDIDILLKKDIVFKLKEILTLLRLDDYNFINELKSLDYKYDIIKKLEVIRINIERLGDNLLKEEEFKRIKINVSKELEEVVKEKVYRKR